MSKYGKVYPSVTRTPTSKPVPGREAEMHKNLAGGYSFTISDWKALDRFLILGTESDTYYAKAHDLSVESAKVIEACLAADWKRTIDRVVEISEAGRAPKNEPALFALAVAASWGLNVGNKKDPTASSTRAYALSMLPRVARIGTDRLTFADIIRSNKMRGWGPSLRNAYIKIFNEMPAEKLARQFAKYQNREGWTTKDLLHMTHPYVEDDARNNIFGWATGRVLMGEDGKFRRHKWDREEKALVPMIEVTMPAVIEGIERAQRAASVKEVVSLIGKYKLEREMIPTQWMTEPSVWEALLPNLGIAAITRNLGAMSKSGLLVSTNFGVVNFVADQFNAERIAKERLHPIKILIALKTYASGKAVKGNSTWPVAPKVIDALDAGFYLSFGNLAPTGKRIRKCLDTSGSMHMDNFAGRDQRVMGISGFVPAEMVAAMSLVTARVEPNYEIIAFDTRMIPMNITPRMRLDDVMKVMRETGGGGTDCGIPIADALLHKHEFDVFEVWTDMEDWAGPRHAHQTLEEYRKTVVPGCKLIGCGVVATKSSIGDQKDPGTLEIVGFDAAAPEIIQGFISGEF